MHSQRTRPNHRITNHEDLRKSRQDLADLIVGEPPHVAPLRSVGRIDAYATTI